MGSHDERVLLVMVVFYLLTLVESHNFISVSQDPDNPIWVVIRFKRGTVAGIRIHSLE